MSARVAVSLSRGDAAELTRLRHIPGVEVCEAEGWLWIRVELSSHEWGSELRTLPGRRFTVLGDGQLIPLGRSVPQGRLPDGPRTPLWEQFAFEMPCAWLGGVVEQRVPVRLIRGGREREANVLRTDLERWAAYVETASSVRLRRWAYAVREDGAALIVGAPLPPLTGTRFVESHGVACPAGWTWDPPVDAQVLAEALAVDGGDLALLHPDGSWERIPRERLVRATRSSVRAPIQERADGR